MNKYKLYMVNVDSANFNSAVTAGIGTTLGSGIGALTGNDDNRLTKASIGGAVGGLGGYGIGTGVRIAKERGKKLDETLADRFYKKSGDNTKAFLKEFNNPTPLQKVSIVMTNVGIVPAVVMKAVQADPTKTPGYPGVVNTAIGDGLHHVGNLVHGAQHFLTQLPLHVPIPFSKNINDTNSAEFSKTNYNKYIEEDPYYSTLS